MFFFNRPIHVNVGPNETKTKTIIVIGNNNNNNNYDNTYYDNQCSTAADTTAQTPRAPTARVGIAGPRGFPNLGRPRHRDASRL